MASSSSSNSSWVRAALPIEEWFEVGHQHGTFLACYVLQLGSHKPLHHSHVEQALLHLYRKVPNLRLSFGTRDGVLWFKETTQENIDFEVILKECDLNSVIARLKTYKYNSSEGPLWCAKFLPAAAVANVVGESETVAASGGTDSGIPYDGSTGRSADTGAATEPAAIDTAAAVAAADNAAPATTKHETGSGAILSPAPCNELSSTPSLEELPSTFNSSYLLPFTPSTATPSTHSPPLRVIPPPPEFSNSTESSQNSYSASPVFSSKSSVSSLPTCSSYSSVSSSFSYATSTSPSSLFSSSISSLTNLDFSRTDLANTACQSLLPGLSSKSLLGDLGESGGCPVSAPVCLPSGSQSTSSTPHGLTASSLLHDFTIRTSPQALSPLLAEEWSPWPCTSHLALGIHHGVADGFTALKICGFFLQLLNDVIAGTPVDDEQQLGEFVAGETFELISARKVAIENNPSLKQMLMGKWERKLRKSELEVLFKVPKGLEDQALHLTSVLDEFTTKLLREKCFTEDVTLHSAFCALATVAFVDLLVEKNIISDKYTVYSKHSTNMRNYWSSDSSLAFGCHMAPINMCTRIPREVMQDFWSFARSFQRDFHREMENATMLQEAALNELCRSDVQNSREMFLNPPPPLQVGLLGMVKRLLV
ncbi:uncharacterized protein [Cherax quadricarinatus]|uniref:uncharacterized protein n=1 Tax=Cherax quadricarinatus TaxID=27406 RepID=UPI00387EE85C